MCDQCEYQSLGVPLALHFLLSYLGKFPATGVLRHRYLPPILTVQIVHHATEHHAMGRSIF